MKFTTATIWIGGATFFSLATQFAIAKLVAVYLSVSDFGIIGQYLSLVTIIQLVGGGLFSTAIIKYFSEYRMHNRGELSLYYNASLSLIIVFSVVFTFLLLLFSKPISIFLFGSGQYYLPIILLSLCTLPFSFSKFVLAVLSGLSKIKLYGLLSAAISLSFLFIVVLIFYYHKTIGSIFLAFPLSYLIVLPFLFYVLKRARKIEGLASFCWCFSWEKSKSLLNFSMMPLITMLLGPIVQISIRSIISHHGTDWQLIGSWQAINKISDAYMMIISMVMLNYLVPLLSPIKDKGFLINELKSIFLKVFYFALTIFIFTCLFKKVIILLLYSTQYLSLTNILPIQFFGDFVRVLGFVIMYTLIAKAQVQLFVVVEVVSTLLLLILTIVGYYYSSSLGGMIMAYLLNACFFFVFCLIAFVIYYKKTNS